MQPLISVDHELRHNAQRDEVLPSMQTSSQQTVREDTPLLRRFPPGENDRNPVTTAVVTLLLVILIAGVVIGVYLLILQSNSENILPPVEAPLQLVSRRQWDVGARPVLSSSLQTDQVVAVQTDTAACTTTAACIALLRGMQGNATSLDKSLPYNFLVSSSGQTYESLGWHQPSNLFPEYSKALVLAFIGNFTKFPPSKLQLEGARNFFAESVSQEHLDPSYTIIGKNTKNRPGHLFEGLKSLPQWNNALSDD